MLNAVIEGLRVLNAVIEGLRVLRTIQKGSRWLPMQGILVKSEAGFVQGGPRDEGQGYCYFSADERVIKSTPRDVR